jgi:hypothetical protein
MLDQVTETPGWALEPDSYAADARGHFEEIEDVFWKLERRQTFQELDDEGYDAFMRGEWEEAIRIEEQTRERIRAYYDKISHMGFEGRRLRIVESPVCPYLQWEMLALRIRAEEGERIRIVDAEQVRHLETRNLLPELIILGTRALYEIRYDAAGIHRGARKIEDRQVIDRCREELAELWGKGEELSAYIEREIVPLPPPRQS